MSNFVNFLFLLQGIWCRNGRAEFCAVTKISNWLPYLALCLYFSFYSLESGFILVEYQYVFVTFHTNFIPRNKLFQC
jgi:hypothetical protein